MELLECVINEYLGTLLIFLFFYPSFIAIGDQWELLWVLQFLAVGVLDIVTKGAGFNPSVAFAMYLDKQIPGKEAIVRSVSCISASLVALPLVNFLLASSLGGVPMDLGNPNVHDWRDAFTQELSATAFLTLCIYNMHHFGNHGRWFIAGAFRFILFFWRDPCMNPILALAYYSYSPGLLNLDFATIKYYLLVHVLAPTLGACAITTTISSVRPSDKIKED